MIAQASGPRPRALRGVVALRAARRELAALPALPVP